MAATVVLSVLNSNELCLPRQTQLPTEGNTVMSNEPENEATPLMVAYRAARAATTKSKAGAVIKKFGGDPKKWGSTVPAKNTEACIKALSILVTDSEDAVEAETQAERLSIENANRQAVHEVEQGFATPTKFPNLAREARKASASQTLASMAADAYSKPKTEVPESWDALQASAMKKFNSPPPKPKADKE
jgi:hypothetical protein